MLNRIEPAARIFIRLCVALFSCLVIVLAQSAFWTGAVSGAMRVVMIITAILAYFRPHYGLLALALLTPLGQVGSRTLDSNMRGAEAVVLAFLCGALVRGWTLHRFRAIPSNVVQGIAFLFAITIVASCIEQLAFSQLQRHFPATFYGGVFDYATRRYLIAFDGLEMIFSAMLLLEGIVLMLYVVHYCGEYRNFGRRLVVALVAGALSAALVNFTYIAPELVSVGGRQRSWADLLLRQRWTFHVGDMNAAASFFAMALFMALGMGWRARSQRAWWLGAAGMIAAAFWLNGSRTALVAVVIAGVAFLAREIASRTGRTSLVATLGAAAILTCIAGVLAASRFFPASFVDATASQAVRIRWLFLGTTWRMLRAEPLFGIGIGQYAVWSRHFSVEEMFAYYARENAHNYFAQIAGELGLLGLASFVGLLTCAFTRARDHVDEQGQRLRLAVTGGLAVFILTWLGNHPLLVAEVSYPFWLALGIAAGLGAGARPQRRTHVTAFALVACIVLAVSVPPRIERKSARIDFTRITYGLRDKEVTTRGRFWVPATTLRLTIPLRERSASTESPVSVDILVDEKLAASITLTEDEWRHAELRLRRSDEAKPRQIDLRIRGRDRSSRVEVGDWDIISTPDA